MTQKLKTMRTPMKYSLGFLTFLILGFTNHAQGASFPKTDIPAFIAKNLNLRSFPNSLRPRMDGTRSSVTFSDLALVPTRLTADIIEFDTDDWFYSLQIIEQGKEIRDNEYLYVCFVDHSKVGSYSTVTPLRLSYSSGKTTAAEAASSAACKRFSR